MSASAAGGAGVDGASAGAGAAASLIFVCERGSRGAGALAQLGSVVVYSLRSVAEPARCSALAALETDAGATLA